MGAKESSTKVVPPLTSQGMLISFGGPNVLSGGGRKTPNLISLLDAN